MILSKASQFTTSSLFLVALVAGGWGLSTCPTGKALGMPGWIKHGKYSSGTFLSFSLFFFSLATYDYHHPPRVRATSKGGRCKKWSICHAKYIGVKKDGLPRCKLLLWVQRTAANLPSGIIHGVVTAI